MIYENAIMRYVVSVMKNEGRDEIIIGAYHKKNDANKKKKKLKKEGNKIINITEMYYDGGEIEYCFHIGMRIDWIRGLGKRFIIKDEEIYQWC